MTTLESWVRKTAGWFHPLRKPSAGHLGPLAVAPRVRPTVHFLHIGKCAGTVLKPAFAELNRRPGRFHIQSHPHSVTLADLPADAPYFFSVRDPVSRFYSGFYSRKRMGRPHTFNPWTEEETTVFERFPHANDLAEALSPGSAGYEEATRAMQAVPHFARFQHAYFARFRDFLEVRPPLCILRQEHLQGDLAALEKALGVSWSIELATDPVKAHSNDYSGAPPLSEAAIANIRWWYRDDVAFHGRVIDWIARNQTMRLTGRS